MSEAIRCEERDDALCALALGELAGEERAYLLAHVEGCSRCAALLKNFSLVADSLLELAPAVEPPLGFEVRLLEDMRRLRPRQLRHTRRTVLAAAAVVLLVGFGVGLLTEHFTAGTSGQVALAAFHSGSLSEGEAVAFPGHPGRLTVTLDALHFTGDVRCMIVTTAGRHLDAGTFWLDNGYGWWTANLPLGAGELRSTILLSTGSHPKVVAEASFNPAH